MGSRQVMGQGQDAAGHLKLQDVMHGKPGLEVAGNWAPCEFSHCSRETHFLPIPTSVLHPDPSVIPLIALSLLCPLQAHRRFLQGVMQDWGLEVLLIHLRVSPISLPFCS